MTLPETLTAGWQVRDDSRAADPESGVAEDFVLLEQAAEGELPPTLRLWENRQCLVVSRRDARLPGFEDARRRLAGCAARSPAPPALRRAGDLLRAHRQIIPPVAERRRHGAGFSMHAQTRESGDHQIA